MASRHPIWLNLAPPARAPQPSEDMWPILRFISRLVRAIVPCGPRDRRSQIGQPTDDSATASLLQHQSGPPSPAPVVIEVEQVSQAQPKEETVSKAAYDDMKQHLEGIIKDLAQPKDDDTVSKAAYNDMKQHLEGIIKDLEEEMMILQAMEPPHLPLPPPRHPPCGAERPPPPPPPPPPGSVLLPTGSRRRLPGHAPGRSAPAADPLYSHARRLQPHAQDPAPGGYSVREARYPGGTDPSSSSRSC